MRFSVLMSVYKSESPIFFNESMSSIWDDQILKPDEIVLVQDGPVTLELNEIISSWEIRLCRILKVVIIPRNLGLGKALSEGLTHCSYELVARMDTDDISLPHRFQHQIDFMCDHPNISACGGWIKEFSIDKNLPNAERRLPCPFDEVRMFARRRCPLNHMTVMFRKSHILAVGGYASLKNSQDYHLWGKLLGAGYQLSNLPDYLVLARAEENLFLRRGGWKFVNIELQLQREFVRSGFIGWPRAIYNLFLRLPVRLAPNTLRRYLYKKVFRNSI